MKNANRKYSNDEINFLKENIDKFGINVCSEKINRPFSGVVTKCYREIGYCNYICNATKEEIDNLVFYNDTKYLLINFELTDHPKELAYFLGYFWADGYIYRNKNLVLEITKNDADDIEHIFMNVASFKRYNRHRKGRQTQSTFHYVDCDKRNVALLNSLGKYPKSIESHEKIFNYIPECYINYFIRGLFDGDGCLYVSKDDAKHHSTQISISGRYDQDWTYITDYIKQKYDLDFKERLSVNNNYKSSCIRATNREKIISFLKKIYNENDGIYLSRKYDKINKLIN